MPPSLKAYLHIVPSPPGYWASGVRISMTIATFAGLQRVRRALKLAKREANKELAEELLPKDDPAAAARMRRQQTNKKKAMQARATPGSPTPFSLCELPL